MKKLTTELFVEKAKEIHGDKYDYSKVVYIDSHTRVCIICPIHGEFWQTPNSHLNGAGCRKCQYVLLGKNLLSRNFTSKAESIYNGKYDYSKVNYKGNKTKVCIICPIHGEFWQTPNHHLKGHGCKECGVIERAKKRASTTVDFIKNAIIVHGNLYDYSKVKYINSNTKISIICPKHGEFWQIPSSHLSGCGCPNCQNSKLENKTIQLLDDKNIEFINRHHFDWLKKQHLDFYLPKYKIAIECQGEQHFTGWGGKNDSLENIQRRDTRKKQLCEENGVKLYYINYNEDVETKLDEILKEYGAN